MLEEGGSSAAPECSNQTDLRLTLADPFYDSDLPERPSPTSTDLVCIQKARGGFGETGFATESATSKSGKAPILEIFSQSVYQSASNHAATVLNGQISAKYESCKSVSFSDGHGGTIRETVHARKAERVGGHPSLLLTEYLTDTKVKGTRLVTKALWTIAGPNVYMIESTLLNVQSPKPALSSLMLKLIPRVRALR